VAHDGILVSGSWTSTLLWLIPLGGSLLTLILPMRPKGLGVFALLVTIAAAVLAFAAAVDFSPSGGTQFEQSHSWVPDLGLTYHVGMDGLSLVLVVLTATCVPCALGYGLWARRPSMRGYAALMLLLQSAVVLLLVARDLLIFYIGFELMIVPLALLIAIWGGPNRYRATVRFVIYTLVGSLLMLISIITLGLHAGSFDLDSVGTSNSRWLFLAFMAAFAIKAPLYPFHGWVPEAYREAPPEIAGLLSGVVSKAGAYGMLRFALPLFPGPAHDLRRWFVAIAIIGLLWSSLMAFRQPDSRGVIAYSSIAQMSLIGLGIFVMNDIGATGATFQMVNHGLLSVLLFLLAGVVEVRTGEGLFRRLGGLARGRPALATIVMTTGIAALAVPGSALFASEFLVLLGAFRDWWLIGAAASLAIVLAAMYMLRWISALLHDAPAESSPGLARMRDVRWEAVYLVPLIAAVLALSVYPYAVTHRVSLSLHGIVSSVTARAAP
jgi:NADH-quinone oxidoreductase subunit M